MSANKENAGALEDIKSVFETSVAVEKPSSESGVSSIASRFEAADTASKTSDASAISSKISSIACAFEPVATTRPATKSSLPKPKIPTKKPDTEKTLDVNTLATTTASPGVSQVAAIFASGIAGGPKPESPVEASAFQKAANAFQQREKEVTPTVESKVSSFAKQLEMAAKSDQPAYRLLSKESKTPTVPSDELKPESLPDRFKATSIFDRTSAAEEQEECCDSGVNRFREAAKVFEGNSN